MASEATKRGWAAVGGAGASTALFTALPIGKLLTGSGGFPLGYVIVVFGLVSLFSLLAAAMANNLLPEQRRVAYSGIAIFATIVLVGTFEIYWSDAERPTVEFTENFEPSMDYFHDPDTQNPIKLEVSYLDPTSGTLKLSPLSSGLIKVKSGEAINLKLNGLTGLTDKYSYNYANYQRLQTMLGRVCARSANNPTCQTWNDIK